MTNTTQMLHPKLSPLPFPDPSKLSEQLRQELANRRNGNVFRMLMHTPNSAPSFLAMTDALRNENSLPPDLRELAILRVGWRYSAPYEVHHHERIGRHVGLRAEGIAAASKGPETPGLTEDECLILRLTDELLDDHGLSNDGRTSGLARLTVNQLADFVLLVGHYQQVCIFLNTFGVPIEQRS
jgi:alkylhydroperoxidase family enzyme